MTGSYLRGHSYYSTNQRILRTLLPEIQRTQQEFALSAVCVWRKGGGEPVTFFRLLYSCGQFSECMRATKLPFLNQNLKNYRCHVVLLIKIYQTVCPQKQSIFYFSTLMESLWWKQIFCLIFVYLTQPEYFRCGEVGYTIENMDHQIGFEMFLCFIFFVND